MNEVTALVLSLGEETTDRAVASARRQTLPPAEVVTVEGVTPFHRAFNTGVSRIATELFIQVDADMVLDPGCVARLRQAMAPAVGIAAGLLRDSLVGKIPAVKLFRTACFDGARLPDSIAPEVDFYRGVVAARWATVYALEHDGRPPARRHTFGEHLPSYTPHYTYSTYYLLGARFRYLRDADGLDWRFRQLSGSAHPMTPIARMALGHGVFCRRSEDVSKSYPDPGEAERLERLLASPGRLDLPESAVLAALSLPSSELFGEFHALGSQIGRAHAGSTLARCLGFVAPMTRSGAWLAEAALAHGLLARDPLSASLAFEDLMPLLKPFEYEWSA